MQKFHKKTFMNKHYFNEGCKWHVTIIIWKLQEGAKRLYCNWYFMINIEVQSNLRIWLRDLPNVLALQVEAALTGIYWIFLQHKLIS